MRPKGLAQTPQGTTQPECGKCRVEEKGRKTQQHLPLPQEPLDLEPQQLRLPPSLHLAPLTKTASLCQFPAFNVRLIAVSRNKN